NAPVTVQLYDTFNNLKINATNRVYFKSTDPKAIFTNTAAWPYQFQLSDRGIKTFSKSNFMFKSSGNQTLVVTNAGFNIFASKSLTVNSGSANGFISFVSVKTAQAGVSFYAKVSSVTDAGGNLLSGTALLSITNGGITSTFNGINISSGLGSNVNQTITTSTTNKVIFKFKVSSVSNYYTISNVKPNNNLGSINLLSTVSTVTAGQFINAPVTVQLYDTFNNLKINATNRVYFKSTDPKAIFTNTAAWPYQFQLSDRGSRTFSKSNFMFKSSGNQTLVVTNAGFNIFASKSLTVNSGSASGFISFVSVKTAQAGVSFYAKVSSVTDAGGNLLSGTALLSITNGGITSTLNGININSGIGSNVNQTITTSTTNKVTFKFKVSSVSNYYTISNVKPNNNLGSISLLSAVSTVTAGQFINAPVTVQLYDTFNNLKINATNRVYFKSTDPKAIFTNTAAKPYQFQLSDRGIRTFSKSNFMFKSSGNQTLVVTNAGFNIFASKSLTVNSGSANGFISFVSVKTAQAGVSFYAKVSSVTDAGGNLLSGTALLSITNGGITSTFNGINISSGLGSNVNQTITTSTTNKVIFKFKVSSVSNYYTISNVKPNNNLGSINLLSTVSTVTAGQFINAPVTVQLYDTFNNLKINATNRVYFKSTDPKAIFTNTAAKPYQFQLSDRGIKTFSKSNFMFKSSGNQTLVVTNAGFNIFASKSLTVNSGSANGFISFVSVKTAQAGVSFYAKVSSVTDAGGNLLSGTALLSITNGGITSTFNGINISSGLGSNVNETITTSTTNKVTFKFKVSNVSNYYTISNVKPNNNLGSISLLSAVSTVTAGQFINSPVTVQLYDTFNNLKINATNRVYFKSTDSKAIFTNSVARPYQFQLSDKGSKTFSKSNFMFKTAGNQTLVVTNSGFNIFASKSLTVNSGSANGFISFVSVKTAQAGVSFYAKVSSVTDVGGNLLSGSAQLSITNGGITSTLNGININSSIGSNVNETITTSTTNKVTFKFKVSNVSNYFTISNVKPNNSLGSISLLSAVSTVTAGQFINAPVTVQLYDTFNNLKINATNRV